jgi:YVTN family beta-propeller protein
MRRPLSSLLFSGFIPVLIFILIACNSPVSGPGNYSSKGSLTIALTNNINAKTLLPTISMDAASYTITGTGPNSATFTAISTGAAVTESSLAFGSWTIVVNALNASGNLIGTGTATAQVNTGATTPVSVIVTPITGTGTLSLSVSWPAAQVQTPSITASLTPALGTAQNLAFTVSGSTATYTNSAVGNGYYTLAFTVDDNGIAEAGAVEVVRIVAGQTTSGTYTFANVNQAGGAITVNINANMQNPLNVAIAGATATMSTGSTQVLTASVSNYTGNVAYIWYVNGVSQATGSSYTFGSGLGTGYYRIDAVAYSADGTQAGSATTDVQISATTKALYVANSGAGTISAYLINSNGALSTISGSPFSFGQEPISVAVSPNRSYLYSTDYSGNTIGVYSIASTGVLTALGETTTQGPWGIAISPNGKYLYVTNYSSGTLSSYTINSTGALSAINTIAAGSAPRFVAISPNGNYLYVADSGYNVIVYAIGSTGSLALLETVPTSGFMSYGLAISPNGNYLYITNDNSGGIAAYIINSDGTLSFINTFSTGSSPQCIVISPNGNYLYTANYGSTTGVNGISAYTIGSGGGLTSITSGTLTTGNGPRSLAISVDGSYLYVTNFYSNNVSAYAIGLGGTLTAITAGALATGFNPFGISIR